MTTTRYFAQFDYATPPQPTALFKVIDDFIGLYFDKQLGDWMGHAAVLHRTIDDMDVWPITPEQAAEVEARFRAV